MNKCRWALNSVAEEHYHDHEWGVPVHDDQRLFEFLVLEGAQAGLSWRTVLEKREAYRSAFAGFVPEIVAGPVLFAIVSNWPRLFRMPGLFSMYRQNLVVLIAISGVLSRASHCRITGKAMNNCQLLQRFLNI